MEMYIILLCLLLNEWVFFHILGLYEPGTYIMQIKLYIKNICKLINSECNINSKKHTKNRFAIYKVFTMIYCQKSVFSTIPDWAADLFQHPRQIDNKKTSHTQ